MNDRQMRVASLCDGVRTSREIAGMLGESQKYVQEVMLKKNLPRRARGSATGSMNASFRGGRKIDRDGYVLVSAPTGHPYARMRKDRPNGVILEHRLIMEREIGRFLLPSETVDHIDGLRLHNAPSNLRLFDTNRDHLQATITGQVPSWSESGLEKMRIAPHLRQFHPRVDKYDQMKKSGDARLIQILRAMLILGKDSPYLLGSSHHIEKAGIVDLLDSSLERALDDLYRKYA